MESDPRYEFVRGDIRSRELVRQALSAGPGRRPFRRRDPRRPVDPRRGRVRPDRRLWDVRPPRGPEGRPRTSSSSSTSRPTRSTAAGRKGFFKETDPLNPSSPYSASKAGADRLAYAYHVTYGMPVDHRPAEQQLRPLPVSGEVHPPVHHQRPGGPAAAALRQGRERPGLAVRRGQLPGDRPRCSARGEAGEAYNIGAGNEDRNIEVARRICQPPGQAARPDHPRPRPAGPRPAVRPRLPQDPGAGLAAGGRLRGRPRLDGPLVPAERGLVAQDQGAQP